MSRSIIINTLDGNSVKFTDLASAVNNAWTILNDPTASDAVKAGALSGVLGAATAFFGEYQNAAKISGVASAVSALLDIGPSIDKWNAAAPGSVDEWMAGLSLAGDCFKLISAFGTVTMQPEIAGPAAGLGLLTDGAKLALENNVFGVADLIRETGSPWEIVGSNGFSSTRVNRLTGALSSTTAAGTFVLISAPDMDGNVIIQSADQYGRNAALYTMRVGADEGGVYQSPSVTPAQDGSFTVNGGSVVLSIHPNGSGDITVGLPGGTSHTVAADGSSNVNISYSMNGTTVDLGNGLSVAVTSTSAPYDSIKLTIENGSVLSLPSDAQVRQQGNKVDIQTDAHSFTIDSAGTISVSGQSHSVTLNGTAITFDLSNDFAVLVKDGKVVTVSGRDEDGDGSTDYTLPDGSKLSVKADPAHPGAVVLSRTALINPAADAAQNALAAALNAQAQAWRTDVISLKSEGLNILINNTPAPGNDACKAETIGIYAEINSVFQPLRDSTTFVCGDSLTLVSHTESYTMGSNSSLIVDTQYGANGAGTTTSQFSGNTPGFGAFSQIDYSFTQAHAFGLLSDMFYNSYTDLASSYLTYGTVIDTSFSSPYHLRWDPIGAFYESRSLAIDNAVSIADRTPVLLNASGQGIEAASLAARDTNHDGKLSGGELTGLTAWVDANENGFAEIGEIKSLADAGISAIRDTNYEFYTSGNSYRPDYEFIYGGNAQRGYLPIADAGPALEEPDHVTKIMWVQASNFRSYRDNNNIYYVSGGSIVWSASQIKIDYYNKSCLIGTDGSDNFDVNYYAAYNGSYFNLSLITKFLAGGGDDVMGGSTRSDMLWGGTGNDRLFGYAGDDKIYGEEGNDELQGNEGHDYLDGGIGDDRLFGHVGNDTLNGGDGNDILVGFTASTDPKQSLISGEVDNDLLYGGIGQDSLYGGVGDDYLDGGDDADLLMGEAGNDRLMGGNGNDELNGGHGNDNLAGEAGDDKLFGNVGNDTLWGGDGNDILVGFTPSNDPNQGLNLGETDNDTLYGGAGGDNLYGGLGDDQLDGGDDNDYVLGEAGDDLLFGDDGNDEVQGGEGNDCLLGEAGNDNLFGQVGNDTLRGGDGDDLLMGFTATNESKQSLSAGETDDDTLFGGTGNDLMLGGLGRDELYGEVGTDELQGGAGNDLLYGGASDDRLFGQVGEDVLYGGDGNDLIFGFTGANEAKQTLDPGETDDDWLYGGAGNDTLVGGLGNDYLDGGAGADSIEGGLGDDTYIVNSVNDSILEHADEGYDTVISSANYILNSGIEELRLVEGLDIHGTGNALDNRIIGNSRDNILDGVTGADVMIGGAGNDTYYVDNAGDQTEELAGEGVDTVQTTVSHTLAANVENLVLLDFAKAEKGLVDGQAVLVYGYPKANELDYMQGDAVPDFLGTCALTSIANLLTQADRPTTETEVVQLAANNGWAVTDPALSPYERGGSNYAQQQAILDNYGIRNALLAGYNENGVANLIRSGRGVILAVNAGVLWNDPAYSGDGSINHVITVTGAVYSESTGALMGFYVADSGRHLVSDMTRFIDIDAFREAAQVPSAYAIYTKEALKLWNENIHGTGNEFANILVGNRGDNALAGLAGNDTLQGAAGNDTLMGGAGSDTYVFGRGDGCDVIADGCATAGESDVLSFGSGITADQLWFQQVGDDLKISVIGNNDNVAIQGWYAAGTENRLQQFSVAGGQTLLEADVQNLVNAMAAFAPPQPGQTTLPDAYQEQMETVIAANWR